MLDKRYTLCYNIGTENKKREELLEMARKINKNEKEVVLDRNKFDVMTKGFSYKDLWHEMTTVYGIDISYNGFGSMVRGLNTWKLTYAWVLAEILKVRIEDLFVLVDVDVEKKIEETLEWQRKYQRGDK